MILYIIGNNPLLRRLRKEGHCGFKLVILYVHGFVLSNKISADISNIFMISLAVKEGGCSMSFSTSLLPFLLLLRFSSETNLLLILACSATFGQVHPVLTVIGVVILNGEGEVSTYILFMASLAN